MEVDKDNNSIQESFVLRNRKIVKIKLYLIPRIVYILGTFYIKYPWSSKKSTKTTI